MNKLQKFGLTAAVLTAALGTSSLAYATVIDFPALAVGNEGDYSGGSNAEVTWDASATGSLKSRPYLDDADKYGPAGLGVCSRNVTCEGTEDDNVGYPKDNDTIGNIETLDLTFTAISGGEGLTISELTFNKRLHGALQGQEVQVGVNGSFANYITDAAGAIFVDLVLNIGDVLSFTHGIVAGDTAATKARDFYLATITYDLGGGGEVNPPVPIPGALPLMLTGIAGLGYLARKRRKAVKA